MALVKHGHTLVHDVSGPLDAGDSVYVECINQWGVVMDAGWPADSGQSAFIVIDFEGHAVPIYPELAACRWKELA
jgi:hypothetical protein